MKKGMPEFGNRVMVKKGLAANDTMAFVGMRGTVVAVYKCRNSKDMVAAVRLDSRSRHDVPMVFSLSQLADNNCTKYLPKF